MPPRVRHSIDYFFRLYASYRAAEAHRRLGDFRGFQVLVTTVSPGRLGSSQDSAPGSGTELFLFVLAAEVMPEAILGPIWRTADSEALPREFVLSTASPPAPLPAPV